MTRQHIFVVNGSTEFLDTVRDLLESESYNVTTTNFVPETFDQIMALEPSLVIVDLAIHGRAGWDLLERLHADATTRGIPIIVVSTDPALLDEAQLNIERFGGQHFLTMPFNIDDLYSAVEDLIGTA